MKKYLMMGLAALAFAACSHDDVETLTPEEQAVQKFESLFIETFGKPAANQDWKYVSQGNNGTTRYTSANGNEWGVSWYVPKPLTAAQKAIVTAYFTAVQNPEGVSVDYTNFFSQNVSSTDHGKSNMDYFYCGPNNDAKDHVNNYNAGDEGNYGNVFAGELKGSPTEDWNNRKVYYGDKIQLQVETSTATFGYHNSYDEHYSNLYVIIPGTEIMEWAAKNAKSLVTDDADVTGMYFIGFDYEHSKTVGSEYDVVEADGYYNDWIIRITPGIKKPNRPWMGDGRIIAEDLGALESGYDIDYNDVVFDAEITSDGARIVLLNAGGTLPLYIGSVEVHGQYGVSTSTMVCNDPTALYPYGPDPISGKYPAGKGIREFFISGSFTSALDIPVTVEKGGKLITLTATMGKPAGKIMVDQYYMWTAERQKISDKYPLFDEWVKDPNVKWY